MMSFGVAGWTAGAWKPGNGKGQFRLPIQMQSSMGRPELSSCSRRRTCSISVARGAQDAECI